MTQIKSHIPKIRFKEFSGEWEEKKLGEVSDKISDGLHSTPIYDDKGSYFFINGNNIVNGGIQINENTKKVDESEYNKHKKELNENTILMSINGTIGNLAFYNNEKIILGKSACYINLNNSNSKIFIYNFLQSKKVLKFFYSDLTGSTIKNLGLTSIKNLTVPIPSLPEQQKIASFLSSVDEKIEKIKEKKKNLEKYKKGIMQKIFSQEIRFKDENGEEFGEWEEKSFGDISDIKRGASPRPITDKIWFDDNSNIGWVRISDVTKSNKYLNKTEQYLSKEGISKSRLIKEGNIIMSICATIGKPIYTNFDVCIHDGFIVFDNLKSNKEYIYYYLEYIEKNWYKYGQPGSQINLNSDIVSNELIYLPISLKEQEKIADFLSGIDEKIEKVSDELGKMEELKKGLLQGMFV